MSKGRVTILGGTGFVGTQLSYRLAEEYSEVVLLSRHTQRSRALRIIPNLHIVKVDVHDDEALATAISNSDVVINLVGILNSSGSGNANSFKGAHADLTSKVVAACESHGVSRYLHMSALNADKNGTSEYLKTKGAAEETVKASKSLNWTIFQPSVIFGEDDSFFNRFAQLLTSLPIFPLACPDSRMAPVFVGDVCQSMMDSLSNADSSAKTIQLVGPSDYTLREIVEYTAETQGLKRIIIGLPDSLSKLQARIMGFVPGKPFSMDNYLSLQTDSIASAETERQTTSIQAIVPRYLGKSGGVSARHQNRRELARR